MLKTSSESPLLLLGSAAPILLFAVLLLAAVECLAAARRFAAGCCSVQLAHWAVQPPMRLLQATQQAHIHVSLCLRRQQCHWLINCQCQHIEHQLSVRQAPNLIDAEAIVQQLTAIGRAQVQHLMVVSANT
jgi:hypothetical protein